MKRRYALVQLRTVLASILAFGLCLVFSLPAGALARPVRVQHAADAAPTTRTFYISGTLLGSSGVPSLVVGLAQLSVASTGDYSGTLTLGGLNPAKVQVTGTISNTMTLDATIGGQPVAVTAQPVNERIGSPVASGPATTKGMEYWGAVMANAAPVGSLTAIDTSILQEYSVADAVSHGQDAGMNLNGSLYVVSDHRGDLQGYFSDDATGAVYPLLSGTLARGQLLVHVDLLGHGNLVGVAAASHSILLNSLVYTGMLYGPAFNDTGTWYSSPPS
jgi:hypothetical protein